MLMFDRFAAYKNKLLLQLLNKWREFEVQKTLARIETSTVGNCV